MKLRSPAARREACDHSGGLDSAVAMIVAKRLRAAEMTCRYGEIQGRYSGDMREIQWRCRGGIGEM